MPHTTVTILTLANNSAQTGARDCLSTFIETRMISLCKRSQCICQENSNKDAVSLLQMYCVYVLILMSGKLMKENGNTKISIFF